MLVHKYPLEDGGDNSQCANGQNHDDRELFSASHLQVPNQEDGKNRESPVARTTDGRVTVEDRNKDVRVHTLSLAASPLGPEVFARQALEQEDEKEHGAVNFRDDEDTPHDGLVNLVDAEAQQHDTDTEFDKHVAEQVEGLAKPPELDTVSRCI
jgi:hypothetical protein